MSAYLDTRVSLYASRLWQDAALDALVAAPDAEIADALMQRGLPQLAAGFVNPADRQNARSLEQRIIAEVLDETRVLIRPLSSDARSFLTFWTARFEISNVKTLLRSKMTGERPAAVLARECGWDAARTAAETARALAHPSVALPSQGGTCMSPYTT